MAWLSSQAERKVGIANKPELKLESKENESVTIFMEFSNKFCPGSQVI